MFAITSLLLVHPFLPLTQQQWAFLNQSPTSSPRMRKLQFLLVGLTSFGTRCVSVSHIDDDIPCQQYVSFRTWLIIFPAISRPSTQSQLLFKQMSWISVLDEMSIFHPSCGRRSALKSGTSKSSLVRVVSSLTLVLAEVPQGPIQKLKRAPQLMTLYLQTCNEEIITVSLPRSASVAELTDIIQEPEGIPSDKQFLVYDH